MIYHIRDKPIKQIIDGIYKYAHQKVTLNQNYNRIGGEKSL